LGDFLGACFFENYRSSPYFRATFSTEKYALISTKNRLGYILGDFFQTRLVSLHPTRGQRRPVFSTWSTPTKKYVSGAGLPDGTFSNQISKFGQIFEGLGMKKVGIFYGH
jgi:hypothetical protein